MRIAHLDKNDFVNGEGISVSLWVQGCPHHCIGCHNPGTWNYDGGQDINRENLLYEILKALDANGIKRNFSILGGEPLSPENLYDVEWIAHQIKWRRPGTKIYLWTGYTYEQIQKFPDQTTVCHLLERVDKLIEGPYIQEQRDITLPLRGSRNQRIFVHPHNCYPTGYMIESIDSK